MQRRVKQRDLKVDLKVASKRRRRPMYQTGSAKTVTEIAALFLQLQGDFRCC
jgi:hypothetical protein